jgi:endo-1,4-beta-xylanase
MKRCVIAFILLLLSLIACQSTSTPENQVAVATASPQVTTISPTSTPSPTNTPTETPTPTSTPIPTATSTPTATLVPTMEGPIAGIPQVPKELLEGIQSPRIRVLLNFQQRPYALVLDDAGNPVIIGERDTKTQNWKWEKDVGLGDLARQLGMTFGIAYHNLDQFRKAYSAQERALMAREASLLGTEDQIMWSRVEPQKEGIYDLSGLYAMSSLAQAQGLQIRAQNVIWSNDFFPKWLTDEIDLTRKALEKDPTNQALRNAIRERFIQLLKNRITNLLGRYKGDVAEWIVVNESLPPDPSTERAYNFWEAFIGSDYIDIAFQTAREADPNAVLILNEWRNDYYSDRFVFLDELYNLAQGLKARNIPVDGVGIQFHVSMKDGRVAKEAFKPSFRKFAQLGLKIYITELDVFDVLDKNDWGREAQVYDEIVRACLEINAEFNKPVCASVTVWGLKDDDTWYQFVMPKQAGYPLLFTSALEKKPAYFAIRKAFLDAIMSMQK